MDVLRGKYLGQRSFCVMSLSVLHTQGRERSRTGFVRLWWFIHFRNTDCAHIRLRHCFTLNRTEYMYLKKLWSAKLCLIICFILTIKLASFKRQCLDFYHYKFNTRRTVIITHWKNTIVLHSSKFLNSCCSILMSCMASNKGSYHTVWILYYIVGGLGQFSK